MSLLSPFTLAAALTSVTATGFFADSVTHIDERTQLPITIVFTVASCAWIAGRWVTKIQDNLLAKMQESAADRALIHTRLNSIEMQLRALPCDRSDCDKRKEQ